MKPEANPSTWGRQLTEFARHPVARNAVALFGVQAGRYLVPLLLVPFLARVLRPNAFGRLAFAQSLAATLGLLAEYGFAFSATREVARQRNHSAEMSRIAAGVLGAKLLLAGVIAVLAPVLLFEIPALARQPVFLWGACFLAVAQGSSPAWFFQGIEQMAAECAWELGGVTIGAIAVFVFVHGPLRAAAVLYFMGAGALAASLVNHGRMYGHIRFAWPRWQWALRALRQGIALFFLRGSVALYTSANVFLLGLFVPAAALADFAGAEKIVRAALAVFTPANQAVFPRMSSLMSRDRQRGLRLARWLFAGYAAAGAAGSLLIALCAPWLVALALGPGYQAAVPLLRWLGLIVFLIAVGAASGYNVLLPLGRDWTVNAITAMGAGVNVAAMLCLVPHHADLGMVWAILASEAVVASGAMIGAVYAGLMRLPVVAPAKAGK